MMRRGACVLFLAVIALSAGAAAQHGYTRAEIENGARLYQASCATCHGPKGDGVRGVALLSGQFRRASSDVELVKIITDGIAGTSMPPNKYSDLEAGMIVAYLRGIASGERVDALSGDVARGKALFEGKGQCTTCHSPTSRMAPPLGDIGAIRRPLELELSLLEPGSELSPDYRFVQAVTKSGEVINGRLMNQSTFSVQILTTARGGDELFQDPSPRLRSFDRGDLKQFAIIRASLMPGYRGMLDVQEVADLVAYLTTLRGQP